MSVSVDFQKEIRKCGAEEIFEEILAKNFKFGKRHKLTDLRILENSEQDKKEILTQTHQNQIAENQRQQKHLESSQGKIWHMMYRKLFDDYGFLFRNHGNEKEVEQYF